MIPENEGKIPWPNPFKLANSEDHGYLISLVLAFNSLTFNITP